MGRGQRLLCIRDRNSVLGLDVIRYEVAKMTRIPVDQLVLTKDSEYKKEQQIDIEHALSLKVFGQDEALERLAPLVLPESLLETSPLLLAGETAI